MGIIYKPAQGPFTTAELIIITVPVLLASLLHALKMSTAYVALPNMQGNLSSSPDQIGWIITTFVVASAVGELLGLITNGENGLLVEEKNPDALAGGMIQLIRDPDFAARLGKGARQFVCDNFALSAMVKNTREFYDEVQNQLQEEWLEH